MVGVVGLLVFALIGLHIRAKTQDQVGIEPGAFRLISLFMHLQTHCFPCFLTVFGTGCSTFLSCPRHMTTYLPRHNSIRPIAASGTSQDQKPAVPEACPRPQPAQLSRLRKALFADPARGAPSVSSHTDTPSFSKPHIPSLQQLTAASASCPEPRKAPTSTAAAPGTGLLGLSRGSLSGREGLMDTGGSSHFDLAAIHRVFSSVDPGHVAGTQALLDSCGWDVGELLRCEMDAMS